MKISIITVVYNGEAFIESCIRSVIEQNYSDLEYIVIDGASKDNTLGIVNRYKDKISLIISEKDKGIYDAMNKGISKASGEVIGILNADDFYAGPDSIASVMEVFQKEKTDMVLGDLVVVNADNPDKIVRYCTAGEFKLKDFEQGDMPPHPATFVKKELYEKFGLFNTKYRMAADYDWMLRAVYKGGATWISLPKILVKMRTGGVSQSGFKSKVKLNREIREAAKSNSVPTSLLKIYSKYLRKAFQLWKRPSKG